MSWIEGSWYQRHIYFKTGPHAAHLDIWTLTTEKGWEEKRVYLAPEHVALMEQARRYVHPYQPSGWGL